MCFHSPPKIDNSAADAAAREAVDARDREEKRRADIELGQTNINTTFSQFDDPFFDARRTAYLDYATPQLDEQFTQAQDNLTFNLARGGNIRSQAAIDQIAKLAQRFQFQQADVLTEADRQRQGLRDTVENEKQRLFNQLDASADPAAAANSALTRTSFITDTPANFSPLGALFQSVALTGANYLAGRNQTALEDPGARYNVRSPVLPGGSGKFYT